MYLGEELAWKFWVEMFDSAKFLQAKHQISNFHIINIQKKKSRINGNTILHDHPPAVLKPHPLRTSSLSIHAL